MDLGKTIARQTRLKHEQATGRGGGNDRHSHSAMAPASRWGTRGSGEGFTGRTVMTEQIKAILETRPRSRADLEQATGLFGWELTRELAGSSGLWFWASCDEVFFASRAQMEAYEWALKRGDKETCDRILRGET